MLTTDLKASHKLRNLQYLILAVVVLLVFGNTIFNGYNMDDNLVTQNHVYTSKGITAIKDILQSNYYSNNSDINFGYRPVTHISFAIEHSLFGESAFTSHFINVLLYVLTVLLFFTLLVRWFKGYHAFIPIVAALLFAVHPVHTEVVASIKNRDEILALLFALCSALAAHKYVSKSGWLNLIGASLFFILALLSKKSVYPLVVIIPIINYLFNKTSFKAALISALFMAVPAAFIAADFLWLRACYILGISLVLYLFAYVCLNSNLYQQKIKQFIQVFSNPYFMLPIAGLVFALSLYAQENILTAIALALLIPVYRNNQRLTSLFLLLLNVVLAICADDEDAISMVLLCNSWIIYTMIKRAERDVLILIVSLIVLAVFGWLNGNAAAILIVVQIALFFFLTSKKPFYGLLLAAITVLVSAYFFKTPIYQWSLLAISAFWVGKEYLNKQTLTLARSAALVLAFAMPLVLVVTNEKTHSTIGQNIVAAFDAPKQTQSYQDVGSLEQNNGIKEGRTLNYIENSLVAPHQISQTISTGLVVLYEYARLMIFPNELSFYYGYATIETTNLNNPKVWLSLLFYVLLVIIAYWQRNKNVVIAIGIAWYVVCILLFSNGVELVAGMVGERLAFTASAGFCMLLAGVFTALQPGFNWLKPKFAEFVVLLLLVLFSIKAVARNGEWKDAITLMTHDIKHLDNSAQAHNLLALNLLYVASNEKDNNKAVEMVQTAITHLEKSVYIYPYFFNTNFDLAKAYFSLSDFNQAKKYLEKSLQLQPQNLLGLELMVMTSYNLQLLTETEYYANQFISQNHDNLNIHQLLVNAMVITGNKEKAIIYANRALAYFPKEATLLKMLADAKAL